MEAIKWIVPKDYSLNEYLQYQGLSFEAFDMIGNALGEKAANTIKGKVVSSLAKKLRSDCREEHDIDIAKIKHGVYCLGLGTGFEMQYGIRSSRIVYIGSGAVYNRIKSHLQGKLFEFASVLQSIPLRFYICDLTESRNEKTLKKKLEQALLTKFKDEIDKDFPLLNKINAAAESDSNKFGTGWDKPVQKEKGKKTTDWMISAADSERWKGAL